MGLRVEFMLSLRVKTRWTPVRTISDSFGDVPWMYQTGSLCFSVRFDSTVAANPKPSKPAKQKQPNPWGVGVKSSLGLHMSLQREHVSSIPLIASVPPKTGL